MKIDMIATFDCIESFPSLSNYASTLPLRYAWDYTFIIASRHCSFKLLSLLADTLPLSSQGEEPIYGDEST